MSPALDTMPPGTKAELLRRVLAMKHPKLEKAPLAAAFEITLAELHTIEEARGLMRLKISRNCTDNDLASTIGRSIAFVSTRLALLNLTPEQQEEVRAGRMKLAEATHHGRMNAGKVMKPGANRGWHLGPAHALAAQVKARCTQLKHAHGRTVGAMGCGECWEHVIRTNERVSLVERSVRNGQCDTCGSVTATPEGAHQ